MAKHVVVTLETLGGRPEDRIVNTFAFLGGEAASNAELDLLLDQVESFYNDIAAGASAEVGTYLSTWIPRVGAVHKASIYDVTGQLAGGPHGAPERERLFQVTPASAGIMNLPEEVAAKLRFEGAGRADALVETADGVDAGTAPDRPRQRLTGGVYIGPLNDNANSGDAPTRLSTAFQEDLVAAGVALATPVVTAVGADIELAVWSRQNESMTTLEACSVDNSFDTIRGRGIDPSNVLRTAV